MATQNAFATSSNTSTSNKPDAELLAGTTSRSLFVFLFVVDLIEDFLCGLVGNLKIGLEG